MLSVKCKGEAISDVALASQLFTNGYRSKGQRRFAKAKKRSAEDLTDNERAVQGGYDVRDPKVKAIIRRWVCEFNKICKITTGESARPIVRRRGRYELTIEIAEPK